MAISKIAFPHIEPFNGFVDSLGYIAQANVSLQTDDSMSYLSAKSNTEWQDVLTVYYEDVALAAGSMITFKVKMEKGWLKLYIGNEYYEHYVPLGYEDSWYEFSIVVNEEISLQKIKIHCEKQDMALASIVFINQ